MPLDRRRAERARARSSRRAGRAVGEWGSDAGAPAGALASAERRRHGGRTGDRGGWMRDQRGGSGDARGAAARSGGADFGTAARRSSGVSNRAAPRHGRRTSEAFGRRERAGARGRPGAEAPTNPAIRSASLRWSPSPRACTDDSSEQATRWRRARPRCALGDRRDSHCSLEDFSSAIEHQLRPQALMQIGDC